MHSFRPLAHRKQAELKLTYSGYISLKINPPENLHALVAKLAIALVKLQGQLETRNARHNTEKLTLYPHHLTAPSSVQNHPVT